MTGESRLLALSALPWLALCSACGPVTYVSRVTFGSTGEIAEVKASKSDQMSPYEYTAAVEYHRRAKELAGYARFHDSNNFAKKARELAAAAKTVAQKRTKNRALPIFDPNDPSLFITRDGLVKRKSSLEFDTEKPPMLDSEKPPLTGPAPNAQKGGTK